MTRTGLILDERYRLDQRIAAGGVGQVWRATDLLLQRPVAVKVLRPEYADHPETLDRFSKEARHAGALSHPHVAAVYDYGPAGPGWPPYLVMEFVDGPSLADILAVEPVEPAFALDVIAQAADGLSAAHRAGLVHRDVKPGNILIGPEGLVKVTDFGIAHAAGQAPVTGPNTVMGTTQYMAPERIAGGQGSPASDLYALGIVLHECLTGEPPYEGAPADIMAAHLYSPLPPLPEGLPPALATLIARLTVKDPADRISDARELAVAAAALRDAIDPGRLAAVTRTGAVAGAGLAVPPAAGGSGPPRAAGYGDGTGVTGIIPGLGGAGRPDEVSDEWAVPERMSLATSPAGLAVDGRPRRPRRGAALAAVAAVVAGTTLVALLIAGALRAAPAANPGAPAAPHSASLSPPGGHPRQGTRPSAPAAGTGGTAVPGTTSPQSSKGSKKKPSPTPSAGGSTSPADGTGSAAPSQSPSGAPSSTPSDSSPGGSPAPTTPASTGPPDESPSPDPTPSPTTSTCVLGVVCF